MKSNEISVARIVRRYKQAKSRYDDLGEKSCFGDGPRERAEELGIYGGDVESQFLTYQRSSNKLKKPSSDLERRIYPVEMGSDFTISFRHDIRDYHGELLGKGDSFSIKAVLTSHAQFRMDERCVSIDQVKEVLKKFGKDIVSAWEKKDYKQFNTYMEYLIEGTPISDYVSAHGVSLAISPLPRSEHASHAVSTIAPDGETRVQFPGSSEFNLSIVTIYQSTNSRVDPREAQCEATLRSLGYELIPKGRRFAKSMRLATDLSFTVKSGFVTSDKTDVPKQFQFNLSVDSELSDDQKKEIKEAYANNIQILRKSVDDNAPATFGSTLKKLIGESFLTLPSGMRLQLKTPAISSFLTFKGPRGGAFELPIATRKFGGGYSSSKLGDVAVYNVELILSTAPASISAPTTRVFEPPTRPVSISPQQRKVQNCIKFLENKYTIIPPQ